MYAEVMGIKTLGEKIKESNEGAISGHSGKKTGEALDEKDKKKKLAESGRKKIDDGKPGRVTKAEQEAIDEGY
jgi:hypothetical protein